MITHDDIFERLKGLPGHSARWSLLKDQVVSCVMKIHCLDHGSIDPLVIAVREQLTIHGQMTIKELCDAVNGKGSNGRRVVSEVLRVLERANEVISEGNGHVFKLSPLSIWADRDVKERTVEKRFNFLPRAHRLEPNIQGVPDTQLSKIIAEHKLDWCKLPDEDTNYANDNLAAKIVEACRLYYENSPVRIHFEESDTRLELLQRSKLMFVDPRFIDANVLNSRRLRKWAIHRCYLYKTRLSWNAVVYSYPRGPEQKGYTDSLNRLLRTNSLALKLLQSVSRTL